LAIALITGIATSCAKGSDTEYSSTGGSTGRNTAVTGAGGSNNTGVSPSVTLARDTSREVTCDAGYSKSGECICIRIAMLGRLPTYGAVPGSDNTAALQAWLNSKSTAVVDTYTKKTDLTAAFLAKYDVLIFQALEDREGGPYLQYSQNEVNNLETWVKNGGGVLTMTGYGNQTAEINPTDKLLSFTGLSYNTDDVITSCPNGCCYCVGSSIAVTGWNPQHPIAANIKAVGAFHARSINVPPNGEKVLSEGPIVLGATVKADKGRVFMFADEWVSYTSQWTGDGIVSACDQDKNNPCYGTKTDTLYQVPQFWYNAIQWVSGDRDCFRIDEPTIIL
jgi:hypothetical protein